MQNLLPKTALIGAASGWGAQKHATEAGPLAVHERDIVSYLKNHKIDCSWEKMIRTSKSSFIHTLPIGKPTLPLIIEHVTHLSHTIGSTFKKGLFPAVIGGDHTCAIGTWQGMTQALDARENFGLIWFDAHMDGHTPETSLSKAYHGMPVAVLLGHGEPSLVYLNNAHQPTLRPQDLVLMGVRSYEPGEADLLKNLGVRIFYMDEIKKRGFNTCLEEALEIVTRHTKGFGISIDLDGFDPSVAPGVGSPEVDGLFPEDVIPALEKLKDFDTFQALEIVEFNPEYDQQDKTYHLITQLLMSLLPC